MYEYIVPNFELTSCSYVQEITANIVTRNKATYKFDQVTLAREQATATTIVDAQTGHKNSDASQFFSPMPFTSNEAQGGGYRIYRAKIGLQAQQFVFAIAISSQPSRSLPMDQLSPLHLTIQDCFVNHPNVQKKPKRHIDQADLQVGFLTLDFSHDFGMSMSFLSDVIMTINSLLVQPLSKCLETCAICTPEQKESSGDLTLTQFSNCTLK